VSHDQGRSSTYIPASGTLPRSLALETDPSKARPSANSKSLPPRYLYSAKYSAVRAMTLKLAGGCSPKEDGRSSHFPGLAANFPDTFPRTLLLACRCGNTNRAESCTDARGRAADNSDRCPRSCSRNWPWPPSATLFNARNNVTNSATAKIVSPDGYQRRAIRLRRARREHGSCCRLSAVESGNAFHSNAAIKAGSKPFRHGLTIQ